MRGALVLVLALVAAPNGAMADDADAKRYTDELGRLINDYRAQQGLRPLAAADLLAGLAHEHAARMAREERLSHDGFRQRLDKAHAPHCVENVGAGYRTARAELDAWRNSPVHDRNLLDARIAYMGLAIDKGYVAFFACG